MQQYLLVIHREWLYNGTTGDAIFTDIFGLATLNSIGWEYCCTPPEDENEILACYEVFNRAFDQCAFIEPPSPPVQATIQTLSEWGLIILAGILGMFVLVTIARKKYWHKKELQRGELRLPILY